MKQGIFITGTNTDIGKTYVSGCITKLIHDQGISCGYYKAALSGAPLVHGTYIPEDAYHVLDYAGLQDKDICVSHIYEHAYSPHLSARVEQKPFQMENVRQDIKQFKQSHDFIIAEGSGGIICPLALEDDHCIMLTDVMRELNVPLLIVTNSDLGTINSTVLTINYARALSLPIAGVIMNDFNFSNPIHRDNYHAIEQLGNIRILSVVAHNKGLSNPQLCLENII